MILLKAFAAAILIPFGVAVPTFITPRAINQVFRESRSNSSDITSGAEGSDSYTQYCGDGSVAHGWPGMDEWVSFEKMFNSNKDLMRRACTESLDHPLPAGSDNSEDEIGEIWNAIQTAAQETGVDHRFILAVMMQESGGCVRVYTTYNPVENPGVMQSHAGPYSCNRGAEGETWGLVNPCPADQIVGMIRDGVSGTAAGDGLAGLLNKAVSNSAGALDGSSAQLYYQAARWYNSGQVDWTNLDVPFNSSRCYTMNIANRLTGWVNAQENTCTEC